MRCGRRWSTWAAATASRARRHTRFAASRWTCASTRWLTPPTGWSGRSSPTTSSPEEVAYDDGDRVDPRAWVAARAALLGGDRAVDRHHGARRRHGPQRHAAGQPGGAGGPAGVRLRQRWHPVRLIRHYPPHELLQPRGLRLRPLRRDPRAPRWLLLRLGPPRHLPGLHRRLHRRGGALRAGLLRRNWHMAQRRVARDLARGGSAHLGFR